MYLTPVFYSTQAIPAHLRSIVLLNPLAVFIEAYRKILLLGEHPAPFSMLYAAGFSFALLLVGIAVFKGAESRLADVL